MKVEWKSRLMALYVCLLMAGAFGAGTLFGSSPAAVQAKELLTGTEEPAEFEVFWQAWDLVQNHFVDRDELDAVDLTYGAIEGMIESLGDEGHTSFLTPRELEYQRSSTSGTFSGIGAQLGVKGGLPVIVSPFDGSPADLAGVRAGDIILEVDREDVTSLPLNEIVDRIRGPEGEKVLLTVLREGEDGSLELTISRGKIRVPAASWGMIPGTEVALLRLSQFSAVALDDVIKSMAEIRGAGAEAVILDVRNNPGGLLEQAIKVTSQFVEGGNILQEEDAHGRRRSYRDLKGGVATDIPLVVLINGGSASSAEILAGAIQDHERATLVGETTFGTGTVLEPFVLEDGSALMLGTRQWLTADGRLIRKNGIEPDVEVDLSMGADLLSPAELAEMSVAELLTSEDEQLLEALEQLDALPTPPLEAFQDQL